MSGPGKRMFLIALLSHHPRGGHHVPHTHHRASLGDVWGLARAVLAFMGMLLLAVLLGVLAAVIITALYHATGGGAYGS